MENLCKQKNKLSAVVKSKSTSKKSIAYRCSAKLTVMINLIKGLILIMILIIGDGGL